MRKIVVDTYGADNGVTPVVKGVARALTEGLDIFPVLVGDRDIITPLLDEAGIAPDRYEILHTDQYIRQSDLPTVVFGGHDDTSMVMAYDRLKGDDECVALLSPGNTGALLVGSICRLGLVEGLKFPALSTAVPSLADHLVCLVDCGANVECKPADLACFAVMGNAFMQSMCGMKEPRVGLLSVGREEHKGNALTKEAYKLIRALPLNFIGNVEGDDLVTGYADVVVADGFAGNILLKNTEAVGKAAMTVVEQLGGDADNGALTAIRQRLFDLFDLNSQGGATFLGPRKTVVKMHGCANDLTAYACIKQILRLEEGGFAHAVAHAMQEMNR